MAAPAPWLSHYDTDVPATLAPYPNRTLVDALYTSHTAPQPGTRLGAIVQTSVFDSINGITRRYAQFR